MRHNLLHKSARCHRGEYGGGSTLLKDCSLLIAAAIKSSLSVNSRGDSYEVLRATQFMLTVASFQFIGKLINTLILTVAKFGQK